jgi:hypothetical protein
MMARFAIQPYRKQSITNAIWDYDPFNPTAVSA